MTLPLPLIAPLSPTEVGPGVDFGARVTNVDLNHLSDSEFKIIEQALYRHKVLIIPNQESLEPDNQFEFVRRFDPAAPVRLLRPFAAEQLLIGLARYTEKAEHGHNDAVKGASLLNGIGNTISVHPEIKLVGGGKQDERFGGRVLKQAVSSCLHRIGCEL